MGLLDKVFGGKQEVDEVPDLEEVMEAEGDVVNPPADFYVKKINLRNEGDAELAAKELGQKNIVLLNIEPLSKQPNRLKTIIGKLKNQSSKINGDMVLLTATVCEHEKERYVILTPTNVKVVKSKPHPPK